jgi:hypothetical protein
MRQIGVTNRAYWRWAIGIDRDWDIPKIGISISIVDDPQPVRILTGLGFRKTGGPDAYEKFGGIPQRVTNYSAVAGNPVSVGQTLRRSALRG